MVKHNPLGYNWKKRKSDIPDKPSNFTCFYIQKYEGIIPKGALSCPGIKNKNNIYSNECINCEYLKKGDDNNG